MNTTETGTPSDDEIDMLIDIAKMSGQEDLVAKAQAVKDATEVYNRIVALRGRLIPGKLLNEMPEDVQTEMTDCLSRLEEINRLMTGFGHPMPKALATQISAIKNNQAVYNASVLHS